jgi:hypothetical protein
VVIFEQRAGEVTQHYTPTEIRTAVTPLWIKYSFATTNPWMPVEIPSNEVPAEIKSLALFSNYPGAIHAYILESNDLMFYTSDFAGNLGLVVCFKTNQIIHDKRYYNWGEGVSFFHE